MDQQVLWYLFSYVPMFLLLLDILVLAARFGRLLDDAVAAYSKNLKRGQGTGVP